MKTLICSMLFCLLQPFAWGQEDNHQITVSEIAPDVYVHTSYQNLGDIVFPSNGLVVNTDTGVVIIDTAWGVKQTGQLLDWISENLKSKPLLAIVTHAHDDRMGGIDVLLANNVRVVSTPLTGQRAKMQHFALPEAILPSDTLLSFGNIALETFYPGEGHAPENIVVWLPRQKVLFGGCLVKSLEAQDLGNVADANLAHWPVAIRTLQENFSEVQWVVPGHGSWGDAQLLQHTLNLLEHSK